MRKTFIAIAASAVLASSGAWADDRLGQAAPICIDAAERAALLDGGKPLEYCLARLGAPMAGQRNVLRFWMRRRSSLI